MKRVLAWTVPVAAATALAPLRRGNGGDAWLFVRAGRTLLSGHWAHAFADPGIQAGPLQLTLFGSVGRSPLALAVVLGGAAAVLVLAAVRSAGVERPGILMGIGIVAVATGLTRAGFDAGHPADTLVPLLWILAAADAQRGRAVRAGALVGLGAGLETWSVLGLAVLALAPRRRDAVAAAATALAVAGSFFLPFVAAGHFGMGAYRWTVSSQSLLSLVFVPGTPYGWTLRVLQGAVALIAGLGVVRAARRSSHALWLVSCVVVLARLALDPLDSGYYFVGVEGPALVGLALVAARGLPLARRRFASEPLA